MSTVRRISQAEYDDQLKGATRVAPGIWIDRHGCPHFSITELLAMVNLPATPENIEQCRQTVRHVLRGQDAEAVIVDQELDI